jgi:hypothetical protein
VRRQARVSFPRGLVWETPVGILVAPEAVLFLTAEEPEVVAPVPTSRPGLVKALPSNVVALPARRVA